MKTFERQQMSSDKKEITKAAQTLNELNFLENDGSSLGKSPNHSPNSDWLISRPMRNHFGNFLKMGLISLKKIEFTLQKPEKNLIKKLTEF